MTVKTLLGGYVLGERLYYIGPDQTYDDGDRVVHGKQGTVVGKSKRSWHAEDEFREQCGEHPVPLNELSRFAAAAAARRLYYRRETLLYRRKPRVPRIDDDEEPRLVHGEQGEVMGPHVDDWEGQFLMQFS